MPTALRGHVLPSCPRKVVGMALCTEHSPVDKFCGLIERDAQAFQVSGTRYFDGPEPFGVLGNELRVEEREAPLAEALDGVDHCHLRGVAHAREHRLARE